MPISDAIQLLHRPHVDDAIARRPRVSSVNDGGDYQSRLVLAGHNLDSDVARHPVFRKETGLFPQCANFFSPHGEQMAVALTSYERAHGH
jgi:hypothetical protein